MTTLTYDRLRSAVDRDSAGLRMRATLTPLAGPGEKVFPPTYGVEDRATSRYAFEDRRVDGVDVRAVVLDSVSSQANRQEFALLDAFRRDDLRLPVVSVDFRGTGAAHLGRLSSLEASHRIFDALLRDSLLDGVAFRLSAVGRAITEASARDAAALFRWAPTTLVFGGWDSTGPRGGLGSRYERAVTSEIVGIGATAGVKTASRLDPSGIVLSAGPLYEGPDGDWTLAEADAVRDSKGKEAKRYARGASDTPGRPSQANLGNVTPTIETRAGGVTVDQILATSVVSFIQLRRLRFPLDVDGQPLEGARRTAAESTGRAVLAALGIAAVVLALDEGFDLRSRCVLVPDAEPALQLVGRTGAVLDVTLEPDVALALVEEATEYAANAGMSWSDGELLLTPADRLVELIRRSRDASSRSVTADKEA